MWYKENHFLVAQKRQDNPPKNIACLSSQSQYRIWFILQCNKGGERGLVVRRWICNPEIPGSNPPPCRLMDLSSVAPNSTPPRCVNSQLVSLPPVGILNLLCLICIIFVCYAHLNIFTWNLRDINIYYYIIIILLYLVIETRVEVWEKEKCYGNTSRRRVFPQRFRVLPNFHECF